MEQYSGDPVLTTSAASISDAPSPLVIEAIGVNHAYEGQNGWVRALEGFEIAIPRNQFLCLLGPSGCGKSSFLRIVTGLMKPMEGEVRLNGKRIEEPVAANILGEVSRVGATG